MNRSAAGLNVRSFSVKIANGQGRTGSSIGNIFTGEWEAPDFIIAPMNRPVRRKLARSGTERVSKAISGMASPCARNASAMYE
jgi:hypothetical protein